jgi:hypothetical protein
MSKPAAILKTTALAMAMLGAATVPGIAGGAFGNWYWSDGSQQRVGKVVAGAAPNIIATGNGVRCDYRYFVQNGKRVRVQVCE